MKTGAPITMTALVITGALLLAACSGNSEDVAGSGGNQPTVDAVAAVDLSALDTGDFPTKLRKKPFETTTENIHLVEAQHLANYTVLPFELDPKLSVNSNGLTSIVTAGPDGGIAHVLSSDLPDEVNQVLYGYLTSGREPSAPGAPRTGLSIASLRYENSAAAQAAALSLYQYWINPEQKKPRTPGKIDILPNTFVTKSESAYDTTTSIASATAHNEFLIYTWVTAQHEEVDWITTTTAKVIAEQTKWLDVFPAADLNDPSTWRQIDDHNIVKYTLDVASGRGRFQLAAYNPRGIAQYSVNPKLSFDVLTEVGAEHNAISGGVVYRAKTDEGAERIVSEFQNDYRIREGFTEVSVPKGLEGTDTECLTHPLKPETVCFTRIGRYVGQTNAAETEATQRISAQYVILQQADQDAP